MNRIRVTLDDQLSSTHNTRKCQREWALVTQHVAPIWRVYNTHHSIAYLELYITIYYMTPIETNNSKSVLFDQLTICIKSIMPDLVTNTHKLSVSTHEEE